MKKFFNFLAVMAIMLTTSLAFSACSEDDDSKTKCYFTMGVDDLQISGSTTQEVFDYMSEVSDAYYKVLGMSSENNTIIIDGDYKEVSQQMKSRFQSAVLPAELQTETKYSFTIVLKGTTLSDPDHLKLIDSKVFSN